MPQDKILLRLAGLACLVGAGLRAAGAFPSLHVPYQGTEALYFAVDLLLTLGLVGLFAGVARFRTWLGVVGFVGALAGFELIRTGARLGGGDAYQRNSAILGLALAVAGLALLGGKGVVRFVGVSWLTSIAVGLAGAALRLPMAFTAASLLFCAGFVFAGVVLLQGGEAGGRTARRRAA
ncbi:MAG TPA: hypothetical protein VGC92_16185 [Phenylobacterium sp.]|jgi:hypothetical protein